MKKIFSLFAAVLFAGSMFAAKSTLTFEKACGGSGTADDGAVWTVSSDAEESQFDNARGIHYGTGSKSVQYLQLETDDIEGTIAKVVVNASDAQACATISVTVGGNAYTSESTTVGNDNPGKDYTFTGDKSGAIVVRIDRGEAKVKALYVKSIEVTIDNGGAPDPELSVDPVSIDFGTVEQGQEIDDKEVEVTFANLTGLVTFSELEAPFSAEGIIESSGDMITISVNTEEIGDFTQTLTIESVDDEKSVAVELHVKVKAPARAYQQTFDLAAIEDFAEWESGYQEHTIEGTDAKIVMASANHQTGTITDIPVTKGGDVELILTNAKKELTAVRFICRQWTTKTQTITLNYSTDGGENYDAFDPAVSSDEFEVEKIGLPAGTNAIKASFSSQSNQVGIESVSFDLQDKEATAINNVAADAKAQKLIRDGQLYILRDGQLFNANGAAVK